MIYYGVLGKGERFVLRKPPAEEVDSLRRRVAQGDTAATMALVEHYQLHELWIDSTDAT